MPGCSGSSIPRRPACTTATSRRPLKWFLSKEEDAYPALPEDGYGWEKLFSERMCRHFEEDFGLQCRVARYHNVYGPLGTWTGGREKAPAAICRKVLEAKMSGKHEIEIWGDGKQTRSFMYIDDCTRGTQAIMESEIHEPINLGSSELVTINQLVDIVEEIAGVKLDRRYKLDAPKGVNGRNSDNTKIVQYLGWEPSIRLKDGWPRPTSGSHKRCCSVAHAEQAGGITSFGNRRGIKMTRPTHLVASAAGFLASISMQETWRPRLIGYPVAVCWSCRLRRP